MTTSSCSGPSATRRASSELPLVADRAVLVPTAEEDPAIDMDVLPDFFARPAGYLFLTPEEKRSSRRVPVARCARRGSSASVSSPSATRIHRGRFLIV